MNDEQLKPCPCCGSRAKFGVSDLIDSLGGEFIECTGCGMATMFMFPSKTDVQPILAERWNRRVAAMPNVES